MAINGRRINHATVGTYFFFRVEPSGPKLDAEALKDRVELVGR